MPSIPNKAGKAAHRDLHAPIATDRSEPGRSAPALGARQDGKLRTRLGSRLEDGRHVALVGREFVALALELEDLRAEDRDG